MNIPPKLFKYCGVHNDRLDRIKGYLLNSELYFSSASQFNDPLDCRIPFSFAASDEIAEAHWNNIAMNAAPHQTLEDRKKRIEEIIQDTKTEAGRKHYEDIRFQSFEKHGILSLTKCPQSTLMWSYYGDSHAGIAIRLNMTIDNIIALTQNSNCIIAEAVYHTSFPTINYYTNVEENIRIALSAKAADWRHEKEWRIIFVNRKGPIRVPNTLIDGIIFGLRTTSEHKDLIRSWIKERDTPTELLHVKQKQNSFELEIIPD